jgi:hypothetical protein
MKPYTFYLHAGHPTPAFDFVHCDSDEDAMLHAQMLLRRFPEYKLIEVYDGATRFSVRREGQAVREPAQFAAH